MILPGEVVLMREAKFKAMPKELRNRWLEIIEEALRLAKEKEITAPRDAERLADRLAKEIIESLESQVNALDMLAGSSWRTVELEDLAKKLRPGVAHALELVREVVGQWDKKRKDAGHLWAHESGTPCPRCGQSHWHWHTGKADDPTNGGGV